VGELFSRDEQGASITSEPLPDVEEIREDIGKIVEKYRGQELIEQFTSYHIAGLIEVIFENDPTHTRLEHLKPEQVQLLKMLVPGLMVPTAETD
jgi:hypothetical protein